MAYLSLYRKWRPQVFDEVIGQEYVTRTLSNSLRSGSFAHAYLFAGPRGTGKTSTARILAKALNCEQGVTPTPCNHCTPCREITAGTSVDVVEIDAASTRGIDSIRELRERVVFSPASARIKVYVLDEAHMLTKEAFNAFLKTLEEPPSHVVFVLATTEPHKMPATILSRCQRYDFRSVPAAMLAEHLSRVSRAEGIRASEAALRLIARRARGSARDALVILEQVMSYGDGVVDEAEVAAFLGLVEDEILAELGDRLVAGDAAGAVAMVERAYEEGRDLVQFAREAQEHFRRVFLLQHADLGPEDLEVDEGGYAGIRRQAAGLSPQRALHFIVSLREAVREMQASTSARLVLESALVGMARSELDASAEALSERLEKLEAEMEKMARKRAAGAAERAVERAFVPAGTEPQPAAPPGREEEGEAEEPPAVREQAAVAEENEAASTAVRAGLPQLDMTAVRKAWPQVKEKVKERKITTHAFLLEGRPQEYRGGELRIVFPPDRSFHRGEMEKQDHREVLEAALEEVLGVPVRVSTALEEGLVGPRREKAAARERGRAGPPEAASAPPGREDAAAEGAAPEEPAGMREEETPTPGRREGAEEEKPRKDKAPSGSPDIHDAGKVKLVKDVFGAEVIEEIRLNE